MTKILKKSLACLLAFVLCFTAIASCLAVSAEAPALSSYFALYAQRPSSNDKAVGGVCEGELLRAQLDVTGLTAGTTMGIAITMPEGVVREDITVSGWNRNTACALNIVSDYLDEETNTFTMVVNVVAGGSYSFFVRFNVTENVPKNSVMKMNCTVEAANTSAVGDENIYTYNSKDAGHERPMEVKAHDEVVDAAVAATCEGTGLTEGSHCSRCEKTLVAQEEVAALGHAWDEGVVDPDATCTDEGVITYTCANDPSHTYTEAISAKGHTPADALVNNGDNHSVVCDVCGAVLETADHEYVDGTCACGATEPAEIVPVEDDTIVVRDTGMLINATLDMRVRVRKSVIPADCVTAKVIVTPTIYDGSYNPTAGTAFVETFEMATASSNLTVIPTNFSLFALDLPMYVKIECYDANENLYKYSPTYTYYPAEELKKQYSASASTDSAKKLNTLITDMLNMSAAAQTYFADNAGDSSALKATVTAGNLVNKDWPQEYATTTEPVYNTVNNLGEANTNTLRLGADLSGAPVISYSVRNASGNLTDKSKLTLTVSYTSYYDKAAGGEVVYDTVEGDEWNKYYTGKHINYNFVDCAMYDGNKTVTFSLTYDGVEVVRSEYSLETYISETAVDDSNLSKCLKAMGIFGASARAYFSTLGTVDPA